MKQIITFSILILTLSAQADTITNWQIYIDDSLVLKCNIYDCDGELTLTESDMEVAEELVILLHNCGVVSQGEAWLELEDSKGRKVRVWEGTGNWGKMTVPMEELRKFGGGRVWLKRYFREPAYHRKDEKAGVSSQDLGFVYLG